MKKIGKKSLRLFTAFSVFLLMLIVAPIVSAQWTNPINAGDPISAIDVNELRTNINILEGNCICVPITTNFGPPVIASVDAIKADHFNDMRDALVAVDACVPGGPFLLPWASGPINAGSTPIRSVHILELRDAVVLLVPEC